MTMNNPLEDPQLLSPPEQMLPNVDAIGSELKDLERQARAFVQQRPLVAVLAAVGLGYLVARLAARANR
jgi:hypothetical protein